MAKKRRGFVKGKSKLPKPTKGRKTAKMATVTPFTVAPVDRHPYVWVRAVIDDGDLCVLFRHKLGDMDASKVYSEYVGGKTDDEIRVLVRELISMDPDDPTAIEINRVPTVII
jgi:hypothetical protein